MKTKLLFAATLASVSLMAQYNKDNLKIEKTGEDQFTFKNLRIFPVYANQVFLEAHKNVGKYMTIQQALDQKKVTITETVDTTHHSINTSMQGQINQQNLSSGATVNTLYAENTSNDTVMIITGDVVRGGKQDRMLAQDVLLVPHSGKVDISVFCVEHGRWSPNNGGEGLKAMSFSSNSNNASAKMRKIATVDKSQQGVWNEVSNVTVKNNATTGSGTFTAVQESKDFKEGLDNYTSHFKDLFKGQSSIIGFVAISGDKIIGCDLFATPALFGQESDNLVKSYSTEAITNGGNPSVGFDKAQKFLDEFLTNESTQEEVVNKSGSVYKYKGRKLHLSKF